MSFNGSGTFVINSSGQPVVANTVISSTVFNALTADLATGLSTCITKDGQTTPTANIPMGTFKFTNLGNGSAATDSATLGQVQASTTKLVTVSGTDTITGTMTPALTAYASGQMFYFVAGGANTGAVTLNIDGLGAKSVTRSGSVALAAGDILTGEVCVVVYDGTRFQLLNPASYTNLNVTGTLTVGSTSTFTGLITANGGVSGALNGTVGATTPNTGSFTTLAASSTVSGTGFTNLFASPPAIGATAANTGAFTNLSYTGTLTGGTGIVNIGSGQVYKDASGNVGIGTASPDQRLVVNGIIQSGTTGNNGNLYLGGLNVSLRSSYASNALGIYTNNAERVRVDSAGDVGIGTNLPRGNLDVGTGTATSITRSIHLGFSTADFYGYRLANTNDASVNYAGTLAIQRGNGSAWLDNFTVDDNANVTAGGGTLATTATNGFLYVPTCAGTPTGTPTAKTGYAAIVVNTTNNKLYFYSGGAWRDAGP